MCMWRTNILGIADENSEFLFLLPYIITGHCVSLVKAGNIHLLSSGALHDHIALKFGKIQFTHALSTIKLADIYEHQKGGPLPLYIHNQAASICHKACDNHGLTSTMFPCICLLYWMEGVPETPYWQMGYGRVQCKRCQGEPMQWARCWQQLRAPLAPLVEWQNWSKNSSVTTCTHSFYVGSSKYTPTIFHPSTCSQDFTHTCEYQDCAIGSWQSELRQQNVTQDTCLAGIYNVTEGKSLQVMASKQITRRQPAKSWMGGKPIFLST
jgi:hypothetical protein